MFAATLQMASGDAGESYRLAKELEVPELRSRSVNLMSALGH